MPGLLEDAYYASLTAGGRADPQLQGITGGGQSNFGSLQGLGQIVPNQVDSNIAQKMQALRAQQNQAQLASQAETARQFQNVKAPQSTVMQDIINALRGR